MSVKRWVWVNGFEGRYKISDDGQVMSFVAKPPRLLKHLTSGRYPKISLGRKHEFFVHVLVAKQFVPGYAPGLQVNHKNTLRDDCRAENLEWVTPQDNYNHAFKAGLTDGPTRAVTGVHKQTGEVVNFGSIYSAAKFVNGSRSAIWLCCEGKNRVSHKNFRWSYAEKNLPLN